MQDSLFLLPFFSKKVRQKPHLLHIFKFLNHISPHVWFQSRKAMNVPWVLEEKTWSKCKRKEKAWISKGFRYIPVVVVAEKLKREKKKSKNFCMYFCFFRVLWWLLALEQRHPVLKTLVFLAPAWVKCRDEHFGSGRRESKKMCRRRGRKKEKKSK